MRFSARLECKFFTRVATVRHFDGFCGCSAPVFDGRFYGIRGPNIQKHRGGKFLPKVVIFEEATVDSLGEQVGRVCHQVGII